MGVQNPANIGRFFISLKWLPFGLLSAVSTSIFCWILSSVPSLSFFSGCCFGSFVAAFFWMFFRVRSLTNAMVFIVWSTGAYFVADCFGQFLGMIVFPGSGDGIDRHPVANASPLVYFFGGTLGAFIVILGSALLLSKKKFGDGFKTALMLSLSGGALAVVGRTVAQQVQTLDGRTIAALSWRMATWFQASVAQNNLDAFYMFFVFLFWQTGIGVLVIASLAPAKFETSIANPPGY